MMRNKYRLIKDKKCLTAAADIFKLFKYFIIRDCIEIVFHNPIISLFSQRKQKRQRKRQRKTKRHRKRNRKKERKEREKGGRKVDNNNK